MKRSTLARLPTHALASAASVLLLSLAACGGGGDAPGDPSAQALEAAGDDHADVLARPDDSPRAQALASGPLAVGALALASSNAAGSARGGSPLCAVSADGSLVAFASSSGTLVSGDTNAVSDVFLKNVRTGAIQRVSSGTGGVQMPAPGASCTDMTPDGRFVLLSTVAGLMVKNVLTGTLTQVTPPVGSVPQNQGFSGGSISDDGRKVVFTTVPRRPTQARTSSSTTCRHA